VRSPLIVVRTTTVGVLVMGVIAGCGGDDLGDAPDVRGLSLPAAERTLKQQNYSADVTSDGLFGVIVEENWTVCEQKEPQGRLVPLEVSKNC
jgi:hypothetical protein